MSWVDSRFKYVGESSTKAFNTVPNKKNETIFFLVQENNYKKKMMLMLFVG